MNELKNKVKVEKNEVNEVKEESKVKGFIAKLGTGVKKHGKKIAGVAIVGAAAVAGYVFGSRSDDDDYFDDCVGAEYQLPSDSDSDESDE